jgi:multimeric flavodoxin WrbA
MLRDWRECRGDDGQCPIDDGYNALFLDLFLPADAIVYATALRWYGMSGHLETFMDRILCCISESYPDAEEVAARLPGKRAALVLSAEESDFGARRAVTRHMQEYCRYLHHDPSGIVTGNKRGEVGDDPAGPVEAARELGRRLFDIHTAEYCLDTERPDGVWGGDARSFPAFWR